MRRLSGGLAAILAACALVPASASATVSCNFDSGPDLITVAMSQATDLPELSVSGTTVVVSGNGVINPSSACSGLPEANKVARIEVSQPGATQNGEVVIKTETPFAPGAGDASEGAGAPELEIAVDLGGGNDFISLMLGNGDDEVRLGTLAGGGPGIDLNAGAEAVGADGDDITMSGVESVSMSAGTGSDANLVDGRGGPEFAAPLALDLGVVGSEGDDSLSGGNGGNLIRGNGGNDTLRGGPANDTVTGNAGRDTLAFDGAAAGVTVNLMLSTAQNTGGAGIDTMDSEGKPGPDIEDLLGSPFADLLIGTEAANRIVGGAGTDTVAALDGADEVRVDDGVGGDSADCGPGADGAFVDAIGSTPLDTATSCEAVAFTDRTPPPPPPPGPSSPAGGGSPGGFGITLPAPVLDTTGPQLRLSAKKRQKAGSLSVRVSCLNEPCAVKGAAAIKVAGSKGRRQLRPRRLLLARGVTGVLRFKLPGKPRRAALLALRRGKRASATITVTASDAAGNVTPQLKRTIALAASG